ncbi:MAG: 6-bladed beta-propeller [Treponema sp.]|jgi:streptogramin lyase|nr:6-bladed beta-propeller [Treponema sp.]
MSFNFVKPPALVKRIGLAALPLLFLPLFLLAQQIDPGIPSPPGFEGPDLDTVRAREEFRIGTQAYNRFAYNEAILSFERALSYRPGEPLILDWLGKAYYHSGIENTAFRAWQAAAEAYGYSSGPGILISSRLETLSNRRTLLPVVEDEVRYVESGRYPGSEENNVFYRQPTSVLAQNDGSAWVVAYGSNELVRIDPNGLIRERLRGPLNGFDRPYDLVRGPEGNLYLSEFRGNRISVLSPTGEWQYYIGSRGQGPGQFVGPQNLAVDEEGYLYVVDYGNRRIVKFDPLGNFILSFGTRTFGFQGFISPTGIASRDGRVYVADNLQKQIYMFDRNGTYLGVLIQEGLSSPESLRFLSDGKLLVVDSNRILRIDPDTAIIRELGVLRNAASVRLTGAEMDSNGNVLVADFRNGEVAVMTRIDDMAAGLFVEITRIYSDNFPRVTVEVEVTDRLRRPVMGLDQRNFLLSEGGFAVSQQSFLSSSYRSNTSDVSILIERSPATLSLRDDIAAAVRDIYAAVDYVVTMVSAGQQPSREDPLTAAGATAAARLATAARGNAASYSPAWRFDLGLRLAATDLLPGEKKRAVVYVGTGLVGGETDGPRAFEQYSLAELAAYLSNNNIVFYAVIIGGGVPGGEIRYLCEETGGQALSLYRNEGIAPEIRKLSERPTGSYTLSYRSNMATDFGRAYLPIEVEVYLMERSGRDSTGYFAPLQ